jgi:hypothetical protein
MDSIKINRPGSAARTTPHTLRWETDKGGKFKSFSSEQKAVRALRMAFKSHVDKLKVAGKKSEENKQYYLEGREVWIKSCDETRAGDRVTYHAVGRAEVGQIHMPTDSLSTDVIAFDITFKDKKGQYGWSDIELVSATIDVLPKGSQLVPTGA